MGIGKCWYGSNDDINGIIKNISIIKLSRVNE